MEQVHNGCPLGSHWQMFWSQKRSYNYWRKCVRLWFEKTKTLHKKHKVKHVCSDTPTQTRIRNNYKWFSHVLRWQQRGQTHHGDLWKIGVTWDEAQKVAQDRDRWPEVVGALCPTRERRRGWSGEWPNTRRRTLKVCVNPSHSEILHEESQFVFGYVNKAWPFSVSFIPWRVS